MKYIKQGLKCVVYLALLLLIGRILFLKISPYFHDYEDEVWQPYQQGDSLVYINNKGDSISWIISQIHNKDNPSDPLLPLVHRLYSTSILVKPWDNPIVSIKTDLGHKSVWFWPPFHDGVYIYTKIDETSFETIRYNQMDVIILAQYREDWHGKPYAQKIYWSSQLGYIKVFFSDGETCELQSFTRKGKCLYQMK